MAGVARRSKDGSGHNLFVAPTTRNHPRRYTNGAITAPSKPKRTNIKWLRFKTILAIASAIVLFGLVRIESFFYREFEANTTTRRTEAAAALAKAALRYSTTTNNERPYTDRPVSRNGFVPRAALRATIGASFTFDHLDTERKKYKQQQQQQLQQQQQQKIQEHSLHEPSKTSFRRVVALDEQMNPTVLPASGHKRSMLHTMEILPSITISAEAPSKSKVLLDFETPFYEECDRVLQTLPTIHPTCNNVHEIALATTDTVGNLLSMKGSWRSVWKIDLEQQHKGNQTGEQVRANNATSVQVVTNETEATSSSLVLKLLHLHRDFNQESFEAHATDSIVMDRLTASPYVVDEYGFCGQSVITEFAESSGRDYVKRYDIGSRERLKVARDLARGLADIQSLKALPHTAMVANTSVVVERGYELQNENNPPLVFAHNDITIANTVMVDGKIKWNDFNIGVFLRKRTKPKKFDDDSRRGRHREQPNRRSNTEGTGAIEAEVTRGRTSFVPFTEENGDPVGNICPSPVKYRSDMWRSPEEIRNTTYVQTTLADMYGLGNILYQTMTRHQPWTYKEPGGALTQEIVALRKLNGTIPTIPEQYLNTTKRELQSLFAATNLCFYPDPRRRPRAQRLAYGLGSLYNKVKRKEKITRQIILDYLVAPSSR